MNLLIFLPELALISLVLVFFVLSIGNYKEKTIHFCALFLSAGVVVAAYTTYQYGFSEMLFFDAYKIDPFSQLFKIIISLGLFLVVYMGFGLKSIDPKLKPEYYMFLFLSALGLIFLTSSVELLTMLVSLEISSFALYVIIPFRNTGAYKRQMEAGIKYVMFGAIATGISLYGMGYIFGIAHTTYIPELLERIPGLIQSSPVVIIGLIMMLAGFFYKLALFPMHLWAPDVYEGAANETTGYIATLPKVAAVALLIRLVTLAGFDSSQVTWILAAFAVLSMTIGNLSALVQEDVKRLLAYSSIAHAGYVMVALLCVNELGYASAIYYIAGYLFMNLACFFVIYTLSENGENVTLTSLGGLYKNSPILALTLAIGAFGMAGIPPTVGFFGKFFIFTAAIQKAYYGLVIITVINAGISAYYYLRIVRAAYMNHDHDVKQIDVSLSAKLLSIVFAGLILFVGIFPQFFLELAKSAVKTII